MTNNLNQFNRINIYRAQCQFNMYIIEQGKCVHPNKIHGNKGRIQLDIHTLFKFVNVYLAECIPYYLSGVCKKRNSKAGPEFVLISFKQPSYR